MPWCLKSLPFVVPVEVSHFAVVVLYISQWMVDRQAHGILKIFSSSTRHVWRKCSPKNLATHRTYSTRGMTQESFQYPGTKYPDI